MFAGYQFAPIFLYDFQNYYLYMSNYTPNWSYIHITQLYHTFRLNVSKYDNYSPIDLCAILSKDIGCFFWAYYFLYKFIIE